MNAVADCVPFCCRCNEEFPVAVEPSGWRMGMMRKKSKVPRKLKCYVEHQAGDYLCGNCYFDLTDE